MKRPALGIFCITFMMACASSGWRAKKMTQVSTENSGVYQLDTHRINDDMIIQKFKLQNGLKVIILEDHSAPVFAYHTWYNVGSRNERDGITGIAHLFEHLLFKETKNTKEGEFDKILEEQGGSINAATYVDWTFYRDSLPKEAFDIIPKLEADRMQWMILNERQINSEREVVLNERRMRVDNSPDGLMSEALYKLAFTSHAYHWPVIGWMKDIEAITIEDCVNFYKTYYSPNNATIVVVGDLKTQDVLNKINQHYGSIAAAEIPLENIPTEPEQEKERQTKMDLTIPAEKMLMGYKIPGLLHSDFTVLSAINAILFEGHSARLYRKLITDSSIVSEVSGSLDHTKDPGLYTIHVSMNEDHQLSEAKKIIEEELEKLKTNMVSQEELARAMNRVETSFWMSFGTADEKAQNLGFYETSAKDYKKLFQEMDDLKKVSPEDIQRVANQYFSQSKRTVVYAHPKK